MYEEKIRERFEAFTAAWNAHDVEAMAACFSERGNITHPWGTFAAGREEIALLLAGEHEGAMRESRWTVDTLTARSLSERAVAVECEGVLEGVRAPNGTEYALPHRINAVLVDEGGWRFLSMNPTIRSADRARG
jgi:uncharacterized protein (TIGR02246 family)